MYKRQVHKLQAYEKCHFELFLFYCITLYVGTVQHPTTRRIMSYSVMQSDGNSLCGDIVLDSFSMTYADEDSILDQNLEKQMFWNLYCEDFEFKKWLRKILNKLYNDKELIKCGF